MTTTGMLRTMLLSITALALSGCEQAPDGSPRETPKSQTSEEVRGDATADEQVAAADAGADAGASPTAEPADAPPVAGTRLTTADGGYWVDYVSEPDPIPLNELLSFTVSVHPCYRLPAGDITLQVDAAMPEHSHGMNTTPKVTALGDGRFRAEGLLLHMAGRWEVYFDVTRDGVTERAQFELELE